MINECLFSMSTGTMSSFQSGFEETDQMFFEFGEDLNNIAEGSSSMVDNLGESLSTLTHNYFNLFLI